jgi:4-carboxymuconolactone decarboxylase
LDKERFEKGLAVRSDVLGAEYVKNTMENASEFSRDFQELLTEYCWGAVVNGVSRDELKAILNQIAIYCGVPVAVECHRIAKKVFAELDGE